MLFLQAELSSRVTTNPLVPCMVVIPHDKPLAARLQRHAFAAPRGISVVAGDDGFPAKSSPLAKTILEDHGVKGECRKGAVAPVV
jgi:hypothetical protein